jgi:hypothetical protein
MKFTLLIHATTYIHGLEGGILAKMLYVVDDSDILSSVILPFLYLSTITDSFHYVAFLPYSKYK